MAPSDSYASLQELRNAHAHLLDREQAEQHQPGFLRDVRRFVVRGQATGVLLDRRAERRAAQSLLDYWVAGLYQAQQPGRAVLLAPFDELAAPALPDAPAPYVGLDAFDEGTEDRFFGRSESIAEMLKVLQSHRLLAVVGTSGSGKSSVVRAGLLPWLRRRHTPQGQRWRVLAPMIPGSDPLESLARAVYTSTLGASGASERPNERTKRIVASLTRALHEGSTTLIQLLDTWIQHPSIITIDQFEETFTLCRDAPIREMFAANLLELIEHAQQPHRLILTMRSDFEAKIALLPRLKPHFDATRVQVTALGMAQLREAIEGPARRVGLTFEEGVVDDLIAQSLGETAALPLLQFTLSRLWELRTRNRVRMSTYQALGGMSKALSTSADAWYQQLIPEDQRTAQRIFLELVRPADPVIVAAEAMYKGERRTFDRVLSEGLEVTRGRVRVVDLYRTGEDPSRIQRVLHSMIDRRLVRLSPGDTPQDDQVEVAHEALIRNWETLQSWIEQDYERLRQRGRLIEAANEWERSGQNADLLLRGSQLEDARRIDVRDVVVAAFVQASVQAEQQRRRDERTVREQINEARRREAEARQREAEERAQVASARAFAADTARRRAEEQLRNTRRLRFLSVVMAILTVIAIGASVIAFNAAVRAQAEAANTEVQRSTAAAALQTIEPGRQTAQAAQGTAQAAATSVQQNASTAVANEQANRETAEANQQTAQANEETARANQAQAEADRQVALTAVAERARAEATAVALVTEVSAERARVEQSAIEIASLNATLEAQNRELEAARQIQATVIADTRVQAFTAEAKNAVADDRIDAASLQTLLQEGLALANNFPLSEAIADGLQAVIQRAETLPTMNQVMTTSTRLNNVAWSHNNQLVAVSSDTVTSIWDIATRSKVRDIDNHGASVQSVVWSRDDTRVATSSNDRSVIVSTVSDGRAVLELQRHRRGVQGVAWSPDDSRIVSVDGAELIVWDSATGTVRGQFPAGGERITEAAWSPDGGNIVTAGSDGLRLRNGETGAELRRWASESSFTSAAWSPDGQRIVTVRADGVAQVWSAASLSLLLTLPSDGIALRSAMWSPDSAYIVTAASDGAIRLYSSVSGMVVNTMLGHVGEATVAVWSLDGRRIVSIGRDRTVRVFYPYRTDVVERARQVLRQLEGS